MKTTGLDKIDKLKLVAIGEKAPNQIEAEQYKKINAAFTLLANGDSRMKVVKQLIKVYELSERQCWNIVRDAVAVYGEISQVDKKGLRNILYDRLMSLSKKAERAKDYKTAVIAADKAAKLMDLHSAELAEMDPDAWSVPVDVVFTSDVNVLKKEQGADIQDVDFEEINSRHE